MGMTSSGDDNQDNMNPTDGNKKVVEFTPRPVLSARPSTVPANF
jgi:hypothetical protein